jgi:hypothetical protein
MSQELKEAYEIQIISLEEYSKRLAKEEGMIGSKFEVARKMLARKMPVSEIIGITGLNEKDVLSL